MISPPASDGSDAPDVTANPRGQEVMTLNDAAADTPSTLTERRCWRCLHMFPRDPAHGPPTWDEFWLCDPCQASLLPSKQRAT